jgi:hypothetical protein
VTTAHAEGLLGADDSIHLQYAASHGYCLLTHNRQDSVHLHSERLNAGQRHAGILVAFFRDVYVLADRVAEQLNTLTADELTNQLLFI